MAKPTAKNLCLVSMLILLLAANGCSGGLSLGLKKDAINTAGGFAGAQTLNAGSDGSFTLYWDHDPTLADITGITYDIFVQKWTEIPADLVSDTVPETSRDDGEMVAFKAVKMTQDISPVSMGTLLASVKGVRAYKLDMTLDAGSMYAFAVRSTDSVGTKDANSRVLVYSPRSDNASFGGITSITNTSDGKLMLNWSPMTFKDGSSADTVSYLLYMSSSLDSLETITAGALAIQTSLTSLPTNGQVMEFPETKLPSANQAPLAETKGQTFYVLDKELASDVTYLFQVRARSAKGEMETNQRVIVYQSNKKAFEGLKESGVILAGDNSKINLTWSAATGSVGKLSYVIYQDGGFTSVLGETDKLTYTIANPTPGKIYVLGVRAKDDNGLDSNSKLVMVPVPDTLDHTPPVFSGLVGASTMNSSKILLKWDGSTSSDLAKYNIYQAPNLATPIASTTATSYIASGLSAGTTYIFLVRAEDISGNEDKNTVQKDATTLSYAVPDFSGLLYVEAAQGVAGLTKIKLNWAPAGGNVTGYQIFMSTTAGGENFSIPVSSLEAATLNSSYGGPHVAYISSGVQTTSATIDGLNPATTYYFVVRAFYFDTTKRIVMRETNEIERSGKTITVKAPTFGGAITAVQGAGLLGLSTVTVNWMPPTNDGAWDSFNIDYEAGDCSAPFSANPSSVTATNPALTSFIVTGLPQPNTAYRFRVRSLYSVSNLHDSNNACVTATTTPTAPNFDGVNSVTTAAGAAGFTTINVSWLAATGSFSSYIVEWSTSSTFATSTTLEPISLISTTSTQIAGLPNDTQIYVRVKAIFTGVTPNLSAGASRVLSAITTPTAPSGEEIATVTVQTATSLNITWYPPSNGGLYSGYKLWKSCGATAPALISNLTVTPYLTPSSGTLSYNDSPVASNVECCYQVRAYFTSGSNSLSSNSVAVAKCATPTSIAPAFAGVSSVTTPVTVNGFTTLTVNWPLVVDSANFSYYEVKYTETPSIPASWVSLNNISDRTQTSVTLTGLTPNRDYTVKVLATNNNGSSPVSNGNSATPLTGRTTPKIPTADSISSLMSVGSTSLQIVYTPPDQVDPTVGGLFNNVFFWVYQGNSAEVNSYQSTMGTPLATDGSPSSGAITLSSPYPTNGFLVQVPKTSLIPGANYNLTLNGLTPNQLVCIRSAAVHWIAGQPEKYLFSQTPTTSCLMPTATAPVFAGVSGLTTFENVSDFTQLRVAWGTITGECSTVDISLTTVADSPNFAATNPLAVRNLACSLGTHTITGLTPYQTYYVQVRANNSLCGTGNSCSSGTGVERSRALVTTPPSGDGVTTVTTNTYAKAPDTVTVNYSLPTAGIWDKISIWRATGTTATEATATVRGYAATKSDHTGPTQSPLVQIAKTGSTPTSYLDNDSSLYDGEVYCYLVRGVLDNGLYYNASANPTVTCNRTTPDTLSFLGASSVTNSAHVTGTCSALDSSFAGTSNASTAAVLITFNAPPSGSVEEFWVYYSNSPTLSTFDFTAPPWQIVDNTVANDFNANPGTSVSSIYVGCKNRTFSGPAYFVVRAKHYGASGTADTNTAVSNLVTIPAALSHYAYVAPAISGLSYPYWIQATEASTSGSLGADVISSTETDLASCNYQFHVNHVPFHSSCGTKNSTATVTTSSVTPANVSWHQAFSACRNATFTGSVGTTGATTTEGFLAARLPTEDEWRRASRFAPDNYANMWTVYSGGSSPNCNSIGGSAVSSGSRSSCVSRTGAFDMVGNLREWVDQRMTSYNITTAAETRFSYGPTIGRLIANGIDTQASVANMPITRRYHNITPGTNNLALLLGSDYQAATPTSITANTTSGNAVVTTTSTTGLAIGQAVNGPGIPVGSVINSIVTNTSFTLSQNATATATGVILKNLYQKQYDAETEKWSDPTTTPATAGFRCVAWPTARLMPTMTQLAQVSEPVYSSSDIPVTPPATTPTAAEALTWKIPENLYVKDTRAETVSHLLSYFPNTTRLAVWPFNQITAGGQTDITGNGHNLTVTGTASNIVSGAGLDGKSYLNTFKTAAVDAQTLSSTDTLFNETGSFSLGLWMYMSSWINRNYMLPMSHPNFALQTVSKVLSFRPTTWEWTSPKYPYEQLSAGWHHIVVVRGSSTDTRLYVDGALADQYTTAWPMSNTGTFKMILNWTNDAGLANAFFHAGTAYTTQQVQRLYYGTMVNTMHPAGPYANSSNTTNTNYDGINITWKPWSKQYCTTSCNSSLDTGFTYYIYRYKEPTRVDIRTRIPWAIQHGPYATLPTALAGATAMPMDPLATDSSGGLLCTDSSSTCRLVATVCGSSSAGPSGSCTSSTGPTAYCSSSNNAGAGCTFTDSAALNNGFSNNAIYNYIMVVGDAQGNYRVPQVQRYRSPYFVGDFSQDASATFRTEQRWRRASIMLADEAMQQNAPLQASQIMSYVPMDVSGLDHDFFIHKYEAQQVSGATVISNNVSSNGTSSSQWPVQGSGIDNTWSSKAGSCYESFWRTGTVSPALCGDGLTTNNVTTITVQSKQNTAPLVNIDQGAFWKACNNTGIVDGSGNIYYLNLVSDAEWLKAADWGDVAQQGTITQSQLAYNIGQNIGNLESSYASLTGNSHNNTTIDGISSTAGLQVGQLLIPMALTPGTYSITAIPSSTSITLSAVVESTTSGSFYPVTMGACNANWTTVMNSNSVQTSNCRSRYGVADIVGNSWEWTNGQIYTGVGYDNGVDGLWLGQTILTTPSENTAAKHDLLRGIEKGSNAPTIFGNGDHQFYTSTAGLHGMIRGAYWMEGVKTGRWSVSTGELTSSTNNRFSARCVK